MRLILLFGLLCFYMTNYAQISANISSQNISCYGLCDGSATVTVNGGTAPFQYNWSNGGNLVVNSNLCAGIYTVTVTDANMLSADATIAITEPQALSVFVLDAKHESCAGMCDGGVVAMASGGTGFYYYSWMLGAPTSNAQLINVCPGNYDVTVTDMNGCIAYGATTIVTIGTGTLSNVIITDSVYNETCLYTNDGAIDVNVSGTNPGPFTYMWDNGVTTPDRSFLSTGSYSLVIYDAANNCLTRTCQVAAIGINCGTISGNVFIDNNANCINNTTDGDYANTFVIANPGNRYGYTNVQGDYMINNVPFGTYSISLAATNNPYLIPSCTTTITPVLAGSGVNANFSAFFVANTSPDIKVTNYFTNITPGFAGSLNGTLNNLNNIPATGVIKMIVPSILMTASTSITPAGYTISGDTVKWSFASVSFTTGTIYYHVNFVTPVTTVLGSLFTSCATTSLTTSDLDMNNNGGCTQRYVTGSFDPNDKAVSPVGIGTNGEIAANEEDLTYLIRFQNTGNGPAVNIVVKDTLSANIDLLSFEVLGASHNYVVEILPGNIVKWKFNNIMLADSGSNEPGSHGFIRYRVKHTVGNIPGAQIKNTAYIYFDFNEPVVTNTTLNTIENLATSVVSMNHALDSWLVYPNPNLGILQVLNTEKKLEDVTNIEILNTMGQLVYSDVIYTSGKTIDLNNFNNGIYFIKLTSDSQSIIKRIVLNK